MKVKLGLIQVESRGELELNLHHQLQMCQAAVQEGAQVILLQELCLSDYFCSRYDASLFNLAMAATDPRFEAFSQLAAEKQVVIALPFFEKRAEGVYHNTVKVWDADGSDLGIYRKMHIPDDPNFYEKYYFSPGDLGYQVFRTRYLNLGTLICWDQWYPEAARITAMKGADLLFYPTAIGLLDEEGETEFERYHSAWNTTQRSHGIDNGVYVASVNRCGVESPITFWGHSFVSGPMGETIYEAGFEETVALVEIDLEAIAETRKTWPFLRDRRIDSYESVNRRWLD